MSQDKPNKPNPGDLLILPEPSWMSWRITPPQPGLGNPIWMIKELSGQPAIVWRTEREVWIISPHGVGTVPEDAWSRAKNLNTKE